MCAALYDPRPDAHHRAYMISFGNNTANACVSVSVSVTAQSCTSTVWSSLTHSSTIFLGVWTLVSTPTAELQYVRSKNHWVCQTGGFTGSPGGYVFFFVLVGALVRRFAFSRACSLSLTNSLALPVVITLQGALLVLGLMLSYLARKVSSRKYMDARVVPLAVRFASCCNSFSHANTC